MNPSMILKYQKLKNVKPSRHCGLKQAGPYHLNNRSKNHKFQCQKKNKNQPFEFKKQKKQSKSAYQKTIGS